MQKLTGKCKYDFETYLESSTSVISMYSFRSYPESCQNALIIDFFDSVGYKIIINPTMFVDDWVCDVFAWTNSLFTNLESRLKAQNKAIEHVNELYNDKELTHQKIN